MSDMRPEEVSKLLVEEIYPKLADETMQALYGLGDERDNEWAFYMGLFLYLTALQMKGLARVGAMTQTEKFVMLVGIEWEAFRKAASMAIKQSDPRLKALGKEEEEGQK